MFDATEPTVAPEKRRDAAAARWAAVRSVLGAQRDVAPIAAGAARASANAPASHTQEQLWLIEELHPGTAQHNLAIDCRIEGALSVPALQQAIHAVIEQHDVLRTQIHRLGDALVQMAHPAALFHIEQIDLSALDAALAVCELDRIVGQVAQTLFALTEPLLPRVVLVKTAPERFCLILCFHHMVFDGWSFAIFMREISRGYNKALAGRSTPEQRPRKDAVSYGDYAVWQRAQSGSGAHEAALAYWRRVLQQPLPVTRLPTDAGGYADTTAKGAGASFPFKLDRQLSTKLERLCASEGVTLFTLLLSAYMVLLYRLSGQPDVVVGCTAANRLNIELLDMMGPFVNTMALRTHLEDHYSMRQLIARVNQTANEAFKHQATPYLHVVQAVAPERRASGSQLFQVMFVHQNLPSADWQFDGLTVTCSNVHSGAAQMDMTLTTWEKEGQIGGLWSWDTAVFNGADVAAWAGYFATLLSDIVADPDKPIVALDLMTTAERDAVIAAGVGPASGANVLLTMPAAFARQVQRNPDAIAVKGVGEGCVGLSYSELDERASQLAARLWRVSGANRAHVGICLTPSTDLAVAMLAVLKLGCAYVPMSCTDPVDRLRQIAVDAHLAYVITEPAHASAVRAAGVNPIFVTDESDAEIDAVDATRARAEFDLSEFDHCTAESIACVMYTSGSSGQPKGACIAHRGIIRLVVGANYVQFDASDRVLQIAAVAFDGSIFEIWGALLNGACLLFPASPKLSLSALAEHIQVHDITVLMMTTGLFEMLVDEHLSAFARVRTVLVGGDILSLPHARRFVEAVPGCRLLNGYGPTENTTFSTTHAVRADKSFSAASIPIGRPISGTQVMVLDRNLRPVAQGVAGEACVAGEGLMLGYLRDGRADPDSLVMSPVVGHGGQRLYRTGDRVRLRRDGEFEFIGRLDAQLKIGGFRIEPAEIEAALMRCPQVSHAAVLAIGETASTRHLVAFVALANDAHNPNGGGSAVTAIQTALQRLLPSAFVPKDLRVVAELPLTTTGKIDRAALRVQAIAEAAHSAAVDAASPPTGETELLLADIFAQALGRPVLDRHASFFDLGGHSLLALKAVSLIEKALQLRVPLVALFEQPSVAGLAISVQKIQVLAARAAQARALPLLPENLVEIKSGTQRQPLFLVPGGNGGMAEMTLYARLLARVGGETRVLGFVARGRDPAAAPHPTVAAMASHYIRQMRQVQPDGPYALCGECVGGTIAFEMAQQLIAAAEQVNLLLLLDTWCPTDAGVRHYRYYVRPKTRFWVRLSLVGAAYRDLAGVVRGLIDSPPRTDQSSVARYAADIARSLTRITRAWFWKILTLPQTDPLAGSFGGPELTYLRVSHDYRPRPYAGAIEFILCEQSRAFGILDDWKALASGGLRAHVVPGTHENYIREFTGETAQILRAVLDVVSGFEQPQSGADEVRIY